MHLRRVTVALLFLPLLYLLIRSPTSWIFDGAVSLAILVSLLEFYRMFYGSLLKVEVPLGLLGGTLFCYVLSTKTSESLLWVLTSVILLVSIVELLTAKEPRQAVKDGTIVVIGIIYIGGLLGHLILLRSLLEGSFLILYLFLVTWSSDTGAYYIGKLMGKRPLAPRISPKKTIEGAIGGLVFGVGLSVLSSLWFLPTISTHEALLLGLILGVVGQLGDLTESSLKRSLGIKDSGRWIPGHGGILDKVDSLLFTAPTFYYYMVHLKQYGKAVSP